MKDPDQTVAWLPQVNADAAEGLWTYDEPAETDDRESVDPTTGLVSLRFLGSSLRRGARVWSIMAVAGLLLGCGWYLKSAHVYKASASALLADNPKADPAVEVQTDLALAESTAVAAGVVRQLGLPQTPSDFLGTYTVTVVSNQVLEITAEAASSTEAVRRAAAAATQFLKFRAQYVQMQQQQTEDQLNGQITAAQRHLDSLDSEINDLSSQASSTSDMQARLATLRKQRTAANNALQQVQQYVTTTLASTRTTANSMVAGSQVLDAAAPVKSSRLKSAGLYGAGGLFGGLFLGMAIVIIGAVTSDRLRRRDDIANAVGAPVRLSVGPMRASRLPDMRGRAARRQRDMDRVVEHLRTAVPGTSRGPAGLAVVAVDDAPTVARAVVALAVSSAKERRRVVVADLSVGTPAARLLGADVPGISKVKSDGVPVVVVVPAATDVAPIGPLRSHTSPDGYTQRDEALAASCASADLVLSLVTLDSAHGAAHLATWATDACAVVTAGLSTAVRIQAAGDMIRLSGTRLGSVVVIDADKSDESLGVPSAAQARPPL